MEDKRWENVLGWICLEEGSEATRSCAAELAFSFPWEGRAGNWVAEKLWPGEYFFQVCFCILEQTHHFSVPCCHRGSPVPPGTSHVCPMDRALCWPALLRVLKSVLNSQALSNSMSRQLIQLMLFFFFSSPPEMMLMFWCQDVLFKAFSKWLPGSGKLNSLKDKISSPPGACHDLTYPTHSWLLSTTRTDQVSFYDTYFSCKGDDIWLFFQ